MTTCYDNLGRYVFLVFLTFTLGKEFKVAIILTEKSFDANLNKPSSYQYLELKKMIEESVRIQTMITLFITYLCLYQVDNRRT